MLFINLQYQRGGIGRLAMSNLNPKVLAVAVVGAAVVAGATTISVLTTTGADEHAAPQGKEQCYGVAKAGENGCASANGSHTCGGLATVDNSGQEWMLVEAGSCLKMGGKLEAFEDAPKAAEDPKGS